jgi:putative FmdB family regulatory protein
MPIYAYKCASCGFAKDALQKISDAPLTVCPRCGKPSLQKQVTAASFQLKGSGWYVTDFRNEGGAPAASAESSDDHGHGKGEGEVKSDQAQGEAKSEPVKTEAKHEPKGDASGSGAVAATPPSTPSTSGTPSSSGGGAATGN